MWVCSAMTTMNHKYLATWFIPDEVIERIMAENAVDDSEYESTLTDLNNEIEKKENELSSLLKDLVGNDDDLKAFSEFINQLGGDANE